MRMRCYTDQKGRSMIEILGVLAIIGVLSIGGIAGYTRAMEKIIANKTFDQISTLVRTIYSHYASQPNFDGLENKFVIAANMVPEEMVTSHDTLVSPVQGEVKMRAVSRGSGFVIVYNNLPPKICADVASAKWGDEGFGIKYLMISPSGYELPRTFPGPLDNGEFAADELPITPVQAATACRCINPTCGIAFFFQ